MSEHTPEEINVAFNPEEIIAERDAIRAANDELVKAIVKMRDNYKKCISQHKLGVHLPLTNTSIPFYINLLHEIITETPCLARHDKQKG